MTKKQYRVGGFLMTIACTLSYLFIEVPEILSGNVISPFLTTLLTVLLFTMWGIYLYNVHEDKLEEKRENEAKIKE